MMEPGGGREGGGKGGRVSGGRERVVYRRHGCCWRGGHDGKEGEDRNKITIYKNKQKLNINE